MSNETFSPHHNLPGAKLLKLYNNLIRSYDRDICFGFDCNFNQTKRPSGRCALSAVAFPFSVSDQRMFPKDPQIIDCSARRCLNFDPCIN